MFEWMKKENKRVNSRERERKRGSRPLFRIECRLVSSLLVHLTSSHSLSPSFCLSHSLSLCLLSPSFEQKKVGKNPIWKMSLLSFLLSKQHQKVYSILLSSYGWLTLQARWEEKNQESVIILMEIVFFTWKIPLFNIPLFSSPFVASLFLSPDSLFFPRHSLPLFLSPGSLTELILEYKIRGVAIKPWTMSDEQVTKLKGFQMFLFFVSITSERRIFSHHFNP